MERDKQQLESLHQQASALYLQGEYVAALEAWSQLLKIDPDDERAREGVRLCELLVEEQGGSGSTPASGNGPKPAGSAPAVGMGIGEDLDEELDELDEMLGGGQGKDWMDAASDAENEGPSGEQAAPNEAIDFDLSEVPSDSPSPAAKTAETDAADTEGIEFNFEGTDQQAASDAIDSAFDFASSAPGTPGSSAPSGNTAEEGAAAPPASPTADSAPDAATRRKAAEELQNRTNELMAEALEHYEKGDREAALGALSRLSILDEENEAARTFADHIRNELEAAQPRPPEPSLEGAGSSAADPASATHPSLPSVDAAQNHEPLDLGEGAAGGLDLGGASQRPVEAPVASGADRFDPFADATELTAEAEASPPDDLADLAAEPPATPDAAKPASAPPTRWLLIAAGVLVFVGGVYVALQVFSGQPTPDLEAPVARNVPPSPGEAGDPAPPPAGDASQNEGGDAAHAQTPAALDPEAVNAAMDRGDRAFEAEDYAAAVLAYNEALKLDPENEVAKRKLGEAGELFRLQKEALEQRRQAIQAFNEGNYRNALRLFYRLEPANDVERDRFMRARMNGWFNLGVQALKSGDCRLAQSHLKEAQSIDPLDRSLRGAIEMTARCFEGQDQAYFDAARGLRFRGLDD